MSESDKTTDGSELITVFIGDLFNCRERKRTLEEEHIDAFVSGDVEGLVSELGPPILRLQVKKEDIEDVIEIFQDEWQEVLTTEGLQDKETDAMDFSQESITCPGCQTETTEVTEDGECPTCGLFLGFPEGADDDDGSDDDGEEDTEIDDDEYDLEDDDEDPKA